MTSTTRSAMPVDLTDAQIEEFGRELDAIRDEVFDSRGERDRRYIVKVNRTQRLLAVTGRFVIYAGLFFLPAWGHPLAMWATSLSIIGLGTAMLGIAKILENMEIGHNVMQAQWDWMKDPNIQSNTWEWDTMGPSDRWMHSHNVVHHTWTNVLGKDLDVGYGIMRVTPMQKWHPAYLFQPITFVLLMLLFEEGVALHEQALDDHLHGRLQLGVEGRAGAELQVRRRQVVTVEVGMLHQPSVLHGHQHGVGHAMLLRQLQIARGVELLHQHDRAAARQRREEADQGRVRIERRRQEADRLVTVTDRVAPKDMLPAHAV